MPLEILFLLYKDILHSIYLSYTIIHVCVCSYRPLHCIKTLTFVIKYAVKPVLRGQLCDKEMVAS